MNDILDAAALRSARVVKAVSRTPFAGRVRYRATVVRAIAVTARAVVEPRLRERLLDASTALPTRSMSASSPSAPAAEIVGHGRLAPAPDGPNRPGDDERCTCASRAGWASRPDWCGATKRDVVHDLMTNGARLTLEQADHIWDLAQASRRDTT